jgi:hypothetical protein
MNLFQSCFVVRWMCWLLLVWDARDCDMMAVTQCEVWRDRSFWILWDLTGVVMMTVVVMIVMIVMILRSDEYCGDYDCEDCEIVMIVMAVCVRVWWWI